MILSNLSCICMNLHAALAMLSCQEPPETGFQAACADPEPGSVILLENLSWRLKTQEQHIDFAIQHTTACRGIFVRFFVEVMFRVCAQGFHIEEEGKNEAKEKARGRRPLQGQAKISAVHIGVHF